MFHHILKISFGQTGFICMKIADSSVVEGKIRKAVSLDCGSEIRNSRFIVFPVHADGTKVEIAFSQVSTLFMRLFGDSFPRLLPVPGSCRKSQ